MDTVHSPAVRAGKDSSQTFIRAMLVLKEQHRPLRLTTRRKQVGAGTHISPASPFTNSVAFRISVPEKVPANVLSGLRKISDLSASISSLTGGSFGNLLVSIGAFTFTGGNLTDAQQVTAGSGRTLDGRDAVHGTSGPMAICFESQLVGSSSIRQQRSATTRTRPNLTEPFSLGRMC
jgi:hypothetical protein